MSPNASKRAMQLSLLGFWLLLSSGMAQAQSAPIHFVGIQRGCERDGGLDHRIERRMVERGPKAGLVTQPSGAPLPACFGEQCAQLFKQSCPATTGRLLGGLVVQGKDVTKIRLWLHDLGTGQTAYQDDYCQGCELIGAVAAQAARLVENPRFASAPGLAPLYCSQPAASAAASASPATGPLFVSVYGDGKHKAPLVAAVKQQLSLLGRRVIPIPGDGKINGLEALQKIVAGQKDAQVLGIDLPKDGKIQMFLFDQRTEMNDGRLIDCADCDKETLIAKVQPEISTMLERCFGDACGNSPTVAPPTEACEPFPEPVCGGGRSADQMAAHPGRYIDPTTAKLVKGSLWSLFAATAVTGITLLGLNSTSVGNYVDINSRSADNTLWRPGWAATGISLGLLGISIPLTIAIDKAARTGTPVTPATRTSSQISCPG